MTNNELAKELRERGDVEHNQFGNALLAAADIVERASKLQRALFHAQNDVSIAKQKAAVLSELNKELRAKDSERDALKDALEIANRSADEQMRYKREAEAERDRYRNLLSQATSSLYEDGRRKELREIVEERDALKAKQADLFTLTDCLASALVGEFKAETALEAYLKELAHDYDKQNMRVRLRCRLEERDALKAKVESLETDNRHIAQRDTLAAENTELKSLLAYKNETANTFMGQVRKLQAENARLREAVEYALANHHEGEGEFESTLEKALNL